METNNAKSLILYFVCNAPSTLPSFLTSSQSSLMDSMVRCVRGFCHGVLLSTSIAVANKLTVDDKNTLTKALGLSDRRFKLILAELSLDDMAAFEDCRRSLELYAPFLGEEDLHNFKHYLAYVYRALICEMTIRHCEYKDYLDKILLNQSVINRVDASPIVFDIFVHDQTTLHEKRVSGLKHAYVLVQDHTTRVFDTIKEAEARKFGTDLVACVSL